MELNELLADVARKGAELQTLPKPWPKMCDGCAFRLYTEANDDQENVELVTEFLMYGIQKFYCHHPGPDGTKPVCAGFRYADHYYKTKYPDEQ